MGLEHLLNPGVLAMLIPISAIVGAFYISALKIKAKMNPGVTDDEKRAIGAVIHENAEIKERLANLESIITSMDKEILQLKAADETQVNQEAVKELSEKMKSSNK